jgi:hypothetical protein
VGSIWNNARGAVILAAVGLAALAYAAYQQWAQPYWLNIDGYQRNYSARAFLPICAQSGNGSFSYDAATFNGACSAASRAAGEVLPVFLVGLVIIVAAIWWARRRVQSS